MPRLRLLPPVVSVDTERKAASVLNYLMNRGGSIAIDTETTGLNFMEDRVLFWSMATEDQRFFFPVDLLLYFDPLFRRKDVSWYLANAKYDKHLVTNMGVDLAGDLWDIIVMDAMDDDTRHHGLKEQASFAYDANWGEFKSLFLDPGVVSQTLGLDKASFARFKKLSTGDKLLYVYDENPELVENYASCDAFFTFMRGEDLKKTLSLTPLPTECSPGFNTLLDYFTVIEVPLTQALWSMEREGFLVDTDYAKSIDEPIRDAIRTVENRVYDMAGTRFNIKSNPELNRVLFSDKGFGMKAVSYTAGGVKGPQPSTDADSLKELLLTTELDSKAYHFIKALSVYRKLVKDHGTYVKSYLPHTREGLVDENGDPIKDVSKLLSDGKIHCKFNQAGARTSRLSSSDPNMQNVPGGDIKALHDLAEILGTEEGAAFMMRGVFVADPGTVLIDHDYPQIEFRIAAALANETKMMEAFFKGWDVHNANTVNMFAAKDPRVTYDAVEAAKQKKDAKLEKLNAVEKEMAKLRAEAKTVGLATLYGEGAKKTAYKLGIEVALAKELRHIFFSTYPHITAHVEYMHDFGHLNGFTHTLLGRMRQLHRINNPYDKGIVAAEERQAYNSMIQGTGAEMIKLAILRVHNSPEFKSLGAKLILTVHDELITKCPPDTAKDASELVKSLMGDPFNWGPIKLTFPVPVEPPDGTIGHRWSDVK